MANRIDNNRRKVRALSQNFIGKLQQVTGGYRIEYSFFDLNRTDSRGNYTDQEFDCKLLRDALIPFSYNRDYYSPSGSSIGIFIFDDEAEHI